MFKTIIAAAIAASSLGVVALPAQAATSHAGVTCDRGASIAGNKDLITQELRAKGFNVESVESWNNCVRAFIVQPNGSLSMAFFEPGSLKQIPTS